MTYALQDLVWHTHRDQWNHSELTMWCMTSTDIESVKPTLNDVTLF